MHRPTRRILILAAGASLVACARRRGVEPVIIGGVSVTPALSIMEAISQSADHRILSDLLRTSGLDEPLSQAGPFTLLAPTDSAFDGMRPKADAERLRQDPTFLKRVLRGHVIPARVSVIDITAGIGAGGGRTKVLPLNGSPVEFRDEDGEMRAYDLRKRHARLGPMGAVASNGLIHVIDDVLLPAEPKRKAGSKDSEKKTAVPGAVVP
jgi:uncharacterized surface protein with fasciclin (FAS1) repeats